MTLVPLGWRLKASRILQDDLDAVAMRQCACVSASFPLAGSRAGELVQLASRWKETCLDGVRRTSRRYNFELRTHDCEGQDTR
jgi:hypothetical protein